VAMNMRFQARFRQFLKEYGLTKAEAARRSQFTVSKATLGNWEDGIPPRPENLERFLRYYPQERLEEWLDTLGIGIAA